MTPVPGLERLLVLDRLEVGPPHLDRRGLRVPYRVEAGGTAAGTTLSYRYEEDVFDPDDPASQNLGALIGAQVALNYGLFAREIRLHGYLDAADRTFLASAASNTAREIFVHKILRDNPFITDSVRNMEAVRAESYLQADIVYDGPAAGGKSPAWSRDRTRIAVLSSGGKESLLSYGLLREAGL
ncbi:MAG: creatininase family protein, partial [Gemmatimonadota bacterium]|nr:creatininase family protein [Gemmatimonadota bacterium]